LGGQVLCFDVLELDTLSNLSFDPNTKIKRAVAQTNLLPFDRLRVNGDILKSCDFSVHAELVEA